MIKMLGLQPKLNNLEHMAAKHMIYDSLKVPCEVPLYKGIFYLIIFTSSAVTSKNIWHILDPYMFLISLY